MSCATAQTRARFCIYGGFTEQESGLTTPLLVNVINSFDRPPQGRHESRSPKTKTAPLARGRVYNRTPSRSRTGPARESRRRGAAPHWHSDLRLRHFGRLHHLGVSGCSPRPSTTPCFVTFMRPAQTSEAFVNTVLRHPACAMRQRTARAGPDRDASHGACECIRSTLTLRGTVGTLH